MKHASYRLTQTTLFQALALVTAVACGGKEENKPAAASNDNSSGGSSASTETTGASSDMSGSSSGGSSPGKTNVSTTDSTSSGGTSSDNTTSAGGSIVGTSTGGAAGGGTAETATGSGGSTASTDTGTDGTAGSTDTSGAVATLGDPCDSLGELACAGTRQKLTLLCGSEGEWEVNKTCGEGEACDSTIGFDQGTCRALIPECQDSEVGYLYCDELQVMACGPDGVTADVAETCTGACVDAACDNFRDGCPDEPYINCGEDCHGRDTLGCPVSCTGDTYAQVMSDSLTVRLPGWDEACTSTCGSYRVARWIRTDVNLPADSRLKVEVGSPWRILTTTSKASGLCLETGVAGCVIQEPVSSGGRYVYVFAEEQWASERNVTITAVGDEEGCP